MAALETALSEKSKVNQGGKTLKLDEHIVEIVSDSGEGAQTAGQAFGTISARMGNGIWTVEIIPAEIEPPPRTAAGASGIRIRLGTHNITNMGDEADLIVAFNEQALLGREQADNLKKGCTILLENKWRNSSSKIIRDQYVSTYNRLVEDGYRIIEIPMEDETLKIVKNPRRGKNMFVLGLLSYVYARDIALAEEHVKFIFTKKGEKVVDSNMQLLHSGYNWANKNLDFQFDVPSVKMTEAKIVTNGNVAVGLGVMASGMDVCAMYPITPATSASHYLSEVFENAGGIVHQAEDEIAACAFAIGASYAGKCAVTITSGPGLALKTELIGLASMAEIPLVIVDVQRGGPSTGLPTKVEQGDLLAALFGSPGDTPKIVMAPATIEDCFYSIITARKIAETFRIPVLVLTDANLATGQQPFPRPNFKQEWLAPPFDQSPVPEGTIPYNWDEKTGLSKRIIPGQAGGLHRVTGLAHTRAGKVAYGPGVNQEGCDYRSLKLAAFQKTLKTPQVFGETEGDLLVVGWGSTKGAIEEAVEIAQKQGLKVSSLHLKFLQPMASGLKEIMEKFKKVITVEINFSDNKKYELINDENRRYANLAWLLRARYLIDIDNFSNVAGQPIKPGSILEMIREELGKLNS
ncbi:MAG: 2-oxoacid:acceptor oxidoreductase subunit alpha [Calditrichae bacterium]|nr:2-oxoacid:acceptor oxidoreductase subunit alpha [Calditrichota bacterium]MCB9058270.1 2-oxoacid:acceptor oxidoreductase subunit alpha [Calditrichia bacterium]